MSELAAVKDAVMRRKNDTVANAPADQDDLTPVVEIWRDDRFIVGIGCPQVDRDQALNAAHIAVPGFTADRVVAVFDAHMSNSPTNPKTGERWGPNEMQGLCDDEGACDLGLITDCMMIYQIDRDGSWAGAILPYHVHKTARTIAWHPDVQEMTSEDEVRNPGNRMEGLIPDALHDAFEKPDLLSHALNEYDGELPENVRLHTDLAVIKILLAQGYMVAYNPADETERAWVDEHLEKFQNTQSVLGILHRLEGRQN